MQGFSQAVVRLLVMVLVMTGVLVAAVFAGVATTTAIAVGIVLAGTVGIVMVARRPRGLSAADEIAAMMAPAGAAVAAPLVSPTKATAVEAMAPPETKAVDPEKFVPRWRRPSVLEARHSDPTRDVPAYRAPMRFIDGPPEESDVRIVRYAVVPVLDRPDEVLGLRVSDLEAGDEVQVIGSSGAFLEVSCPSGDRGWIHRTTLGQKTPAPVATVPRMPARQVSKEADDALTALLSARGLI